MINIGDITEDSEINFKWHTTDGSGGSITRDTNGTLSVYKDDDLVQSTAGITDTEDFDSLTGVHHCKIDTSADAFYAVGHDYDVVLNGAVIDGQTVNAVIAHFSIESRPLTEANTELASIPTTVGSLRKMIQFLFQYYRNVRTASATTMSMKKENGSDELGSATLSDDGETKTKGELS